ncbi:GIY-YIG nuclease family protein [Coprococcus sp. MSK.21.13]|nr:GIY-YIG nuclease family protein [Coprococcus sp. MSK.21.13]
MSFNGYTNVKLKELVNIERKNINPQKYSKLKFEHYSLPAFDNNRRPELSLGKEIKSTKYILPYEGILFSKLNLRFKRVWKVYNKKSADTKICSSEFFPIVIKDKKRVATDFLYYTLISDNFISDLEKTASGTSGSHQRISADCFLNKEIILPKIEEQKAIARIFSTLDEKIETNNQINKKLEEMAQAIFKQWFVDFEFPCLPKNYKFSGAGKPCNPRGSGKPDDYDKVLTYNRVGGLPVPDGKSWFVYVLLCDDGSFYKGMTKDLYRRFYEHYTGIGAEWTKIHKPVKVIHYEKFNSQQEARKREEELKSGYGREWIKREYKKYQEGLSAHEMKEGLPAHEMKEGLPAHKMKEGLPAHKMKEGLSAHEMKAGSPAHQTHLMMAGEMVESELGMIPKGWEVKALGNIIEIFDSKRIPLSKKEREKREKIYPYYGAASLMDFVDDYIFDGIYILMGEDGTVVDTYGFPILQYVWGRFWVNNHAHVIKGKGDISDEFIYILLKNTNVSSIVTGAVQPKINQQNLKGLKIAMPRDNKLIVDYSNIVKNSFEKVRCNSDENNILINIRDTLLPKLMSGEIRVPLDN